MTVTGRQQISPHFLRLSFHTGGMLAQRALHPTMWIRMWFADGAKLHQRGYTEHDEGDHEARQVSRQRGADERGAEDRGGRSGRA